MKPRYEIHSLSMSDVVEPPVAEPVGAAAQLDQQDLSARALFSATELPTPARLDVEFGRSLPQDKFDEYQQRYREAFADQVRQIAKDLNRSLAQQPSQDITSAFANLTLQNGAHPRDAWNTPLHIERTGWNQGSNHYFVVRSAGPDRQFDTSDDLTVYVQVTYYPGHFASVVTQPGQAGSLDLRIEHDRGPFNGLAEVAGSVSDPTGAFVAGSTITLRLLSTQGPRPAPADAAGQFSLPGLPAGRHQFRARPPFFQRVARH